MTYNRFLLITGLVVSVLALSPSCLLAKPSKAKQVPPTPASASSLEVTADESLEWYQDKKLYVARGNAKAVKDETTIEADILTAHQKDTSASTDKTVKDSGMGDIDRLTAEGNVRIIDPRQKIFGDLAVYDLNQHLVQVTGKNLKYLTETETITARDALEYYELMNLAVARGHATGVHQVTPDDKRQVSADVLSARFTAQPDGSKTLSQIFADGHVVVVSKGGVTQGDHAVYDVKKNVAVLTGNVKVAQESAQLAGNKAEVDFATGHSRLLNDGKGRVRAMILGKTRDASVPRKVLP